MTNDDLPAGWSVFAQRSRRRHYDGHEITRYAYALERPGWFVYVSAYRYTTEESAISHGLADAETLLRLQAEATT